MPFRKYFFIEDLNPLYEDVQSREIFKDSKFFVDCVPKIAPGEILQKYAETKSAEGFELKEFIAEHFSFPEEPETNYESANKPIMQHLQDLWEVLERKSMPAEGTLIPLPYPYIVPGGRFREIYYWDSYFTILGLQVSKRVDIIQHMVDNFAYLINEIGFIPNGNRSYYLGRSQPPFFAMMVSVLAEEKGDKIFLQYQGELEKEYEFWMDGLDKLTEKNNAYRRLIVLPNGSVLNRHWDDIDRPRPEAYMEDMHIAGKAKSDAGTTYTHIRAAAESGWDFSSRWFADGHNMETIITADLIPVDLNCLLLNLETILLKIYLMRGDKTNSQSFNQKIEKRKEAIETYCWDDEKGFYFDFNHRNKTCAGAYTLAGIYPLFFNIASAGQADKIAAVIRGKFLKPGGLVTTIYHTGQQWDAPNGWAPLQWMTYKGLFQYGHRELARDIKQRWLSNCEKTYNTTGKMMEKYNVMDTSTKAGGGEYPNQDGFGWTNGVYLKMVTEAD
jgi:alpha,alpha-trehalase